KEIRWVVFGFDLGEALVIAAVSGFHSVFAFIHHEVDVSAAGRVGMKRVEVLLRPLSYFFLIRRVGIDTDHHLRPIGVAVIPRGLSFSDATRGSVDWIKMHRRMHRRKRLSEANML